MDGGLHPDYKDCQDKLTDQHINAAKEKILSVVLEEYTIMDEGMIYRDFVSGVCYLGITFQSPDPDFAPCILYVNIF